MKETLAPQTCSAPAPALLILVFVIPANFFVTPANAGVQFLL
jgi:hypothetical protein